MKGKREEATAVELRAFGPGYWLVKPNGRRAWKKTKKAARPKSPVDSDAVWAVACPVCKARVGEYCRTPTGRVTRVHARRSKMVVRGKKRTLTLRVPVSSKEILGGAFEMNRRRH
jgi:hypothetical protein